MCAFDCVFILNTYACWAGNYPWYNTYSYFQNRNNAYTNSSLFAAKNRTDLTVFTINAYFRSNNKLKYLGINASLNIIRFFVVMLGTNLQGFCQYQNGLSLWGQFLLLMVSSRYSLSSYTHPPHSYPPKRPIQRKGRYIGITMSVFRNKLVRRCPKQFNMQHSNL